MKALYFCTLFATAVCTQAQTLNQANNAPAAGDNHSTYQCDSTGISPGASGAGAVWNYSSIVTHSSVARTYTVNAYSSAAYAPANVVKFSSQTDIAHYRSNSGDLSYYGGSIAVSTVVATAIYANPATRAVYPMSLNSSSTAPISGTLNLTTPFAISATFNGNSNVVADGSGTLLLPGGASGTFSTVLRVVSSQTLNFTVAFPPTTGTLTERIYDNYRQGTKAPLFSIRNSTVVNAAIGTVTASVVTINQNYMAPPTLSLSVSEMGAGVASVNVFPNPASQVVNLVVEQGTAAAANVYDITGKLVDRLLFFEGKTKLDVSGYSNGLYIYKVTDASGNALKTGKLTVNH